jgi:hypothetical protein
VNLVQLVLDLEYVIIVMELVTLGKKEDVEHAVEEQNALRVVVQVYIDV